jgi:hypothetical protein
MQHSTWIWYPADFEIWLGNRFNNRRTERGAMFPPFWKQDSHWATVEFSREYELEQPETIHIYVEGQYNFMFDGKLQFGQPKQWLMPAGRHKLNIKVHNPTTPPALFIEGETIHTDSSWRVTHEDKIWIDENGVAHGSGIYLVPGFWHFNTPTDRPSNFQLAREEWKATSSRVLEKSTDDTTSLLVDFGKETMGYIVLNDIQGQGVVEIYYGESKAEALDKEYCETLDKLEVETCERYVVPESKAFRFVHVVLPNGMTVGSVSMQYEYQPQDLSQSGSFECSDEELNRIWQVGAYTMDLTTREFMMDGIKRDRWTWSGDAIQSYLMNYYLRFDSETVKRTIRQLRGKDPVTSHVNTILDYTFYWFKSVYDFYQYTGDRNFVVEMYPRMLTLMDYCLGRLHEGWAIGQPDDWVFIDWVDFPMHKRGIVCFEQILFCKSLETMQLCKDLVGSLSDLHMSNLHLSYPNVDYGAMAAQLKERIDQTFWSDEAHAYLHALESTEKDGQFEMNPQVNKFANMFAILYGYADQTRQQEILKNVMQNPDVPAITTPYMRFYELAALCQLGLQDDVLTEIKAYWGGMLREGATSFWEKYNPEMHGDEHLTMYGRPYGKSLCHAWGASPVYLLGRYYLGIEPTSPGYASWQAKPHLSGLDWMRGAVPTPFGPIHIEVTPHEVTITSPEGIGPGTLSVAGNTFDVAPGQTIKISC